MQLHPTRSAVDLTVAGIALVTVGIVVGQAAIVAWGGALLIGLQIARAVTLVGVSKVRASGFEMIWRDQRKAVRVGRGERVELQAEVRNRDARAARYVQLRALHAPNLELSIEPRSGEVPAGGRLAITLTASSQRVGRHGIYGLSLEVRGSPGLYEVPLTFSNPLGIEVLPAHYAAKLRTARGGRSRSRADSGQGGRRAGGDYDLREVREYQSGDPYKRIAWNASARRGQLMVREFDLEERDVVWLLLDASVELWSGVPGDSPLDRAIDQVAAIAAAHLERRDPVGLAIIAGRRLAWLKPAAGAAQANQIYEALAFRTGTHDADRSSYDEADISSRVLEHLRPLSPELAGNLRSKDVESVARRASTALRKSPFSAAAPFATSQRERVLRHYLAGFGIDSPPRLEPDRPRTDPVLAETLKEVMLQKPRPSLVYCSSPAPEAGQVTLLQALRRLPVRRSQLRWLPMELACGYEPPHTGLSEVVSYAVTTRAKAKQQEGAAALRKLGIRVQPADNNPRSAANQARRTAMRQPPPQTDGSGSAELSGESSAESSLSPSAV